MNKVLISLISIFLSLAVLPSAIKVSAQQAPTTVIVKDPNGGVIPGARVTVKSRSGTEVSGMTNSDGRASFETLAAGDYLVVIDAAGFPQTARQTSFDGSGNLLDVALSIGSINESVTVTATRTQVTSDETAVPITIIGRDRLEREQVNTVGDLFRSLPGTSTTNEGAFQVRPRIRGLESNRILILVDGERLNNARTSTGQSGIEIGLVDINQIETIEVARGAGSVLYGTDALAGTINIITNETPARNVDGFRFGGYLSGYFSSNEKGRRGTLALTGSGKHFAFRAAQTLERYDNYRAGNADNLTFPASLGFVGDREVGNSQSHGGATQLTGRLFFDDNTNLKLNYERRRALSIGSPLLTSGFGFNAFFPYSNRDKVNGRFEARNLNKYLASVAATFYFQDQKRNFTNITPPVLPFFRGSYSETTTDTRSFGYDVQTNWLLGSKNFLTTGISHFVDENEDERLQQTVLPPIVPNRTTSVPRADFGSFAFFAQDEFTLTSRLKFVGGVRIERFFSNSKQTNGFALPSTIRQFQLEDIGVANIATGAEVRETAVTGDLGAVYKVSDNLTINGRIGRSFRVANLFERFFTGAGSVGGFLVGNPSLNPESGINLDVGARVKISKLSGSFTYFNNTYRDFLSSTTAFDRRGCPVLILTATTILDASACQVVSGNPTRVQQTINFGKVRLQGFEVEAEMPFRLGDIGFLTPGGNISYLRGDNLQTSEPFNIVPKLKTVVNLRWNDAGNRYYAEGQTRVVSRQDRLTTAFRASNGGDEPGYAVTDIRGGYNFRRELYRFAINAGVTNVFDRFSSEQFVLAPARGRSFVIGTTIEFNR